MPTARKTVRPSKAKVKRGKGRPPRDLVGRESILRSTRELLKQKAPSELSRVNIAAYCGVDPGLIRYYFGTTDGLLTEVATQIVEEMHAHINKAIATGRSSEQRMRSRVRVSLDMHEQNPHLNELIIQKILGGTRAGARRARSEMIEGSIATLTALIDEGVKQGDFRKVDPRLLHIALVGMSEFFFTGRPVVQELFGRPPDSDLIEEYGKFVADLILGGIAAPAHRRND